MMDVILIALSGAIVFAIGLPMVKWYSKAKKEMEAQQNDDAE
jgi:hypothetical protein